MASSPAAGPASTDFTAGTPVDGAAEPAWIHGAPPRQRCTDPPIQVHRSDPHTFILRVSKALTFEAPFVFLLFGNDRAVLLDTGTSPDPARVPLRPVIDELISAWLAEHPRDRYQLVVAHTHGHRDHRGGDPQFTGRPDTTVVGPAAEDVAEFFGFSGWPEQVVPFDLGGRVLEVTGIEIGDDTLIGQQVSLTAGMLPGQDLGPFIVLSIGDRCVIGRGSHVVAHQSVTMMR